MSKRNAVAPASHQNFERFRGLTRDQIEALLLIDERAMHVQRSSRLSDADGGEPVEHIEAAYHDAGIPFTPETIRAYAEHAESLGRSHAARAWYAALAELDPNARDAYEIREGCWPIERMGELTAEQRRTLFAAQLAYWPEPSDHRSIRTLDTVATYGDRRMLLRFLRRAVACGRDRIADAAAERLHRTLTQPEIARLIRFHLREVAYPDPRGAAIRMMRKYRCTRAFAGEIITRAIASDISYRELCRIARLIGIRLTNRQLEIFVAYHHAELHTEETLRGVRALARRSPRWRPRLSATYAWARQWSMDPKLADTYGRRCGRPFTPTELLVAAERLAQEDFVGCAWARSAREFAIRTAADRIALAVGAREMQREPVPEHAGETMH